MSHPDRLDTINELLALFKAERPELMRNNWSDSMALFLLLQGEVEELGEELAAGNFEEVPKELADVLIFALEIAQYLGIDIYRAVLTKIARNFAKFPEGRLQGDVPYEEVMPQLRTEWEQGGGDAQYYQNGVDEDAARLESLIAAGSTAKNTLE